MNIIRRLINAALNRPNPEPPVDLEFFHIPYTKGNSDNNGLVDCLITRGAAGRIGTVRLFVGLHGGYTFSVENKDGSHLCTSKKFDNYDEAYMAMMETAQFFRDLAVGNTIVITIKQSVWDKAMAA